MEAETKVNRKFIVDAYVKKEERYQIKILNFYLMILEKEQQIKPKASRREK
jgi:hypothetical protein